MYVWRTVTAFTTFSSSWGLVSQHEKVSECGYCGFLPLRGHFMAHQAQSAAEPSMGSLTPSSLLLCFPDLLATPHPPLSSFACSLLTHSLSHSLAHSQRNCVLAKSIWIGWGQTGWSWRVLLCDPGSASCPLHWRVEGGLLAVLQAPFIKLWEILSKHLIVFFKTFVKVEHSQSLFKASQFTWRPSWHHLYFSQTFRQLFSRKLAYKYSSCVLKWRMTEMSILFMVMFQSHILN